MKDKSKKKQTHLFLNIQTANVMGLTIKQGPREAAPQYRGVKLTPGLGLDPDHISSSWADPGSSGAS